MPPYKYNIWNYKNKLIYPVNYGCNIYLDNMPMIKLDCLLTGKNSQKYFKKIYES